MSLKFDTLRAANQRRMQMIIHRRRSAPDVYPDNSPDWGPAEWLQALIGELGEYANLMKKVGRGDFDLDSVREDIAKELADVQTYLDLLADLLDIDLGEATIAKFNEVSDRRKLPIKIWWNGDGDYQCVDTSIESCG